MSTKVVMLDEEASLDTAAGVVEVTGHTVFRVIDEVGHLQGIVVREDLPDEDALTAATVGDIAGRDVVTIESGATIADASRLMIAEGVDDLPVVNADGILIGMCTRTDILRAARLVLAAESHEAGWLSRYRRVSR